MRVPRLFLLLLLAFGTPAASADPPSALAVQELEGRLADAEKRAAFEADERERLVRVAEELRARVSALSADAGRQQRGIEELGRLKDACEEREEALRADLDLCGRTRARAEEQKARCGSELGGLGAAHRSELEARERVLEECRGRSADLEAQNLLLAAEKKAGERERQESVDEITYSYDDLLASIRKDLSACQERAVERERADSAAKARRAEESSRVLAQLHGALSEDVAKKRVVLSDFGARVVVKMSLDVLYAPKTTEWKPTARKMLKALSDVLRAAADRAVIVEERVTSRPGAFSNAVRLASFLRVEGGLNPGKVAIADLPPSNGSASDSSPGVVVTSVPLADFEKLFPGAEPTPTK